MARLRLEVVTGERLVYADDVDVVVAPGAAGELAILPNHAPLLTTLKPGELRMRKGSEERHLAVTGGFLEVLANKVMILADAAEYAEEIDEQRAQEAIRRAQERVARREADIDLERALHALQRAQVRLKVARRRRGPGISREQAGPAPGE